MKSWLICRNFPNEYQMILDSQDIDANLNYFGISNFDDSITALMVKIGDGEIIDLWYSIDVAPYLNSAIYEHVSTIKETDKFYLAENFILAKSIEYLKVLPFEGSKE